MQAYYDVVVNTGNDPVANASVFVYDATGALATIYDSSVPVAAEVLASNGTPYFLSPLLVVPQANPITTGLDGRYLFFAANGIYTVVITANGYNTKTLTVSLNDPSDAPGITYTTYTTAPNNLVNAASLQPKVSTANGDLALVPKGQGALLGQVPTGTAAGGNKRGNYAVDWQTLRAAADQVASGIAAVVGGGESNKSSNFDSTVAGGSFNQATGIASTVGGGSANQATGNQSTVAGGSSNLATNFRATIGGGRFNAASGQYATIAGGQDNTASGNHTFNGGGELNVVSGAYASVLSGYANLANAKNSAVLGGAYGTTRGIIGYAAFPSHDSPIAAAAGVSQGGLVILGRQTTNATPTILSSDANAASAANQLILANNSAAYVFGYVIANVTGAGDTKSWIMSATVKRGANAATTTVVGSIVASQQADAGASTWDVTVAADTTNGGLAVTVTGQASTTIRWACKLETVEVAY